MPTEKLPHKIEFGELHVHTHNVHDAAILKELAEIKAILVQNSKPAQVEAIQAVTAEARATTDNLKNALNSDKE